MIIISRFAHDAIYSVFPEIPAEQRNRNRVQIENDIARQSCDFSVDGIVKIVARSDETISNVFSVKASIFGEIPAFRLRCFNRRPFIVKKERIAESAANLLLSTLD